MKLLSDEQLCYASYFELIGLMMQAKKERVNSAKKYQWQRHQEIGEYLHKIEQLITEKQQQ